MHEATKRLTNIIQHAHKNHIPQGNIRPKTTILPDDIRQLISRRNDIRQTNSDNPEIPTLNTEITAAIRDHKRRLWREHLDKAWDYRQNTNILYDRIRRLQNKRSADEPNRMITFNNKVKVTDKDIVNAFTKQYTNSTPKETDKQNMTIDRHIKRLRSNAVILTTRDTNKAIQKTSTKKSLGPDKIAPIHLKHLGPKAITKLFNKVLNSNIIPHEWKLARLSPIHKPNNDKNEGSSYRPISLLLPLAKTLEKVILNKIRQHIPNTSHQHRYKAKHSTVTAIHTIVNTITKGFIQGVYKFLKINFPEFSLSI